MKEYKVGERIVLEVQENKKCEDGCFFFYPKGIIARCEAPSKL